MEKYIGISNLLFLTIILVPISLYIGWFGRKKYEEYKNQIDDEPYGSLPD